MPSARSRVQPSARSRCARNVMRGAARSRRATKPANRFSTIIARRSSPARSIMPTANSATRFTTGARSCRARCTRTASLAATATIRIAESCARKATRFAPPVICRANTTRRHTTTTSPPVPAPLVSAATCRPTTYMVVDPRHDHSLRVPRPDLSVKFGTPNACNGCHTNRDARWAANASEPMVWT